MVKEGPEHGDHFPGDCFCLALSPEDVSVDLVVGRLDVEEGHVSRQRSSPGLEDGDLVQGSTLGAKAALFDLGGLDGLGQFWGKDPFKEPAEDLCERDWAVVVDQGQAAFFGDWMDCGGGPSVWDDGVFPGMLEEQGYGVGGQVWDDREGL